MIITITSRDVLSARWIYDSNHHSSWEGDRQDVCRSGRLCSRRELGRVSDYSERRIQSGVILDGNVTDRMAKYNLCWDIPLHLLSR